jgi:enamine deaminase RidA (YjgF/YER057c/UK114 family)
MNPVLSSRPRACFGVLLFCLSGLLLSVRAETPATVAPQPPLEKQKFHLGPWEQDIGYTQAVRVGNTLYLSGTTGRGEMAGAVKNAYDGIAKTLAAYGLGFGHVVKENVYTTDIEALKANKGIRNAYYGGDFPAATWVQISRLFTPETVLEVEVTAVFPDKKP